MVFDNWVISGCVKFRMFDNKTSSFEVVGNIPDGWNWYLLYTCNDNLNIVDMVQSDSTISVLFTKEMLPMEGTYYFQLKATKGELVKHTNIVKSYVNKSLSGDVQWPVVPSEFTDIENAVKGYAENAKESAEKAENAAVHSPIIGSNGNWWVWNFDTSEYIDTGVSASGGGGDISLGVTSAAVGDIIKVAAVDADGKPTAWEAAELSRGAEIWEKIVEIDFATDVANDVHTWTFSNLPGYKALLFKRVSMTGSTATASWLTCKINGISSVGEPQQIPYQKQGQTGSGFTFDVVTPEGILCVGSPMSTFPTNYAQGVLQTPYNLFPYVVQQITKIELKDNALYPIASGELIIYGLRGVVTTQEEAT